MLRIVCIVCITSLELPPMAVQYRCHVSPSVSRDQYTALPLVEVLVNLRFQIGCVFVEYDRFKLTFLYKIFYIYEFFV